MVGHFAVTALIACGLASGQTLATRPALTLEGAKRIAAAAEAEAPEEQMECSDRHRR